MSYANIIENLPDELILLTEIEVEGITHRKRQTLRLDRIKGGGIPFIRVGKRQVRYRLSDVKATSHAVAWTPPPKLMLRGCDA